MIATRATPGAFQHSMQPTDQVRDLCNVPFQPDDEVAHPDGRDGQDEVPFVPPPHVPAVALIVIHNRSQRNGGGRRQCSIYMRPNVPLPPASLEPAKPDPYVGLPALITEYSDDDDDGEPSE